MPNFCTQCGASLSGPFCVKCGADARQGAAAVPLQTPSQPLPSPPPSAAAAQFPAGPAFVPSVPTSQAKTSPLMKLAIAAVAIIFVGGAVAMGGMYYVAHRISQRIHAEARGLMESSSNASAGNTTSESASAGGDRIDACSLLSAADVSRAIGAKVVRAQPGENSCSYIAKGDPADMAARHATAMMAARGADKQAQKMIQTFAGGMFKTLQNEDPDAKHDTSGEVTVLAFSVDQNGADAQMQLNSKTLGILGDKQDLSGIGDQAFVSADSVLMVRKSNKLIRIMYMSCPCGTSAVKPLAKKIADAL